MHWQGITFHLLGHPPHFDFANFSFEFEDAPKRPFRQWRGGGAVLPPSHPSSREDSIYITNTKNTLSLYSDKQPGALELTGALNRSESCVHQTLGDGYPLRTHQHCTYDKRTP